MNYSDMQAAVDQARATLRHADSMVPQMLRLIKGRLRLVPLEYNNVEALIALKKELRGFNLVTGRWKEGK